MTTIEEQLERLTLRNKKLAAEKSYLQLTISVMNSVAQAGNLEDFTEMLPKIIIDAIGGTNVILYYKLGEGFCSCDAFEAKNSYEQIEDLHIVEAIEKKEPLFLEVDFSETLLNTEEFTKAWTWVYPLMVGTKLIGILKLENLHIGTEGWHEYIPALFGYIVTQLNSRILQQQQEELQKRLAENERYLRALMDTQPNIVIVNDGQKLIDANRAFFDFFSDFKSVEEFRKYHKCICEFFEKSERADYLAEWQSGKWWLEVVKEHPSTLHKVLMKKDGKPRYFALKLEFLKLGDVTKNIATFTDITALEESNITLEQRVEEELQKRKLQEEKMLNQARLAQMGEMLTMISHHWRQPLMVVSLTIQNLQDAYRYNELTQEHLDKDVEKVMRTLDNLSQTLTTLSSLTARQKERRVFNVSEATKKLCELSVAEFDTLFINFSFAIEDGILLEGVVAFYTQILTSLLKNAQEAVLQQEINERTINLSLSKSPKGGTLLEIKDSGCGIKEEYLPRVFDPFFTTKEITVKTGLGLYFVKMIVEQQFEGTIEVHNSTKGAKFIVYLPNVKMEESV